MNDLDRMWLAGLLEGEGCFAFAGTPKIILEMTDEDVVERAAFLINSYVKARTPKPNRKQVFHTEATGERARNVMEAILPHMGKRRSAKIREVLKLSAGRPGVAIGDRCGASKISNEDAEVIRYLYLKRKELCRSGQSIAEEYGVSQAAVWYIANKRQPAAIARK